MRYPIVLGGLYNGKDKPPTARAGGRDQKVIRTRHGHGVLLDDTRSRAAVRITSAAGHVLELDDQGGAVRITAAGGGGVTVTARGEITLRAPKVTVDSPSGGTFAEPPGPGAVCDGFPRQSAGRLCSRTPIGAHAGCTSGWPHGLARGAHRMKLVT